MKTGLLKLQARFRFEVDVVDIDRDDALVRRYGEDVPVLAHGERELCRHRLDSVLVTDYLAQMS